MPFDAGETADTRRARRGGHRARVGGEGEAWARRIGPQEVIIITIRIEDNPRRDPDPPPIDPDPRYRVSEKPDIRDELDRIRREHPKEKKLAVL